MSDPRAPQDDATDAEAPAPLAPRSVLSERFFTLFRLVALVEGVTTLALFLVAMPVKYASGNPSWVAVTGPIHGYAFLAYLVLMVAALAGRGWGAGAWARTAGASLLPFGTFLNDRFLIRRKAAETTRPARRGPPPAMLRHLFLTVGLFFTGLGFLGAFLPVLPTVPFLLLATACFARSSERLEAWLMEHPHFGPLLQDWRQRGAIPMRAKWMSLAGTTLGFVLFVRGSHPGWPLMLAVAALMLFGVVYVFTRPTA